MDVQDPEDILHHIEKQIKGSGLKDTFLEILQSLMLISTDQVGSKSWLLISRVLRQVALHKPEIEIEEGEYYNNEWNWKE